MTEQDLALPDKFIYKQNEEENLASPFMVSKIRLEIGLMINAVSWKTDEYRHYNITYLLSSTLLQNTNNFL